MIIKDNNLQHVVNVYYTTNFDDPWYQCHCGDSICRCLKITSIDGVDVDIEKLSKSISKLTDPIDIYGLQRILSINECYDLESYSIDYGPDYYGEVIYSVELKSEVLSKIDNEFIEFKSKNSLRDKTLFLLELEYGNIPEFLLELETSVISIKKDDIIFPNKNHARITRNMVYPISNGGKIPLGVCREVSGGFSVIDGYNRLSRISEDIEKIKVICFS